MYCTTTISRQLLRKAFAPYKFITRNWNSLQALGASRSRRVLPSITCTIVAGASVLSPHHCSQRSPPSLPSNVLLPLSLLDDSVTPQVDLYDQQGPRRHDTAHLNHCHNWRNASMSDSKPAPNSAPATPPGSQPRIPESYIEIPDQRRYILSLGVACQVCVLQSCLAYKVALRSLEWAVDCPLSFAK